MAPQRNPSDQCATFNIPKGVGWEDPNAPPSKIEDVGMRGMFCLEAELYETISEVLTPPTPGFVKNM